MSLPRRLQAGFGATLLILLLWAALAPLGADTRERPLEFARGAASGMTSGVTSGMASGAPSLPAELRLTLGVSDVLLLRNRDRAPHVFGQVLVAPGHVFRLPFEQVGDYPFACDAAPGARIVVHVLPEPDPGWRRLRWRLQALFEDLRDMPLQGPGE